MTPTPSKKSITPHKGGRTASFPRTRLTPAIRAKLDTILALLEQSAADWVSVIIEREYADRTQPPASEP